jgi:hypothetical protein
MELLFAVPSYFKYLRRGGTTFNSLVINNYYTEDFKRHPRFVGIFVCFVTESFARVLVFDMERKAVEFLRSLTRKAVPVLPHGCVSGTHRYCTA